MSTIVTTQAELDAALDEGRLDIIIDSPAGVWLTLDRGVVSGIRGSSCVGPISGSATVSGVRGSATVSGISGSATVRGVSGSATVRGVSGSATVSGVWDSATVSGVRGSATVRGVSGSATVSDVWDSATVGPISGSATVSGISGSATVWGVSGSATVSGVSGSATVHLYDRASATRVGSHVAVFIHSLDATTDGGVVIRTVDVDKSNPVAWCALNAIPAIDGKAVLYKAVDGNLVAGHDHTPTAYPLGATVTAADWSSDAVCGRGLHFGRSPRAAHVYYSGDGPPRFLACEIDLSESVPLDDKIKARSCRVLHEVDIDGNEVAP